MNAFSHMLVSGFLAKYLRKQNGIIVSRGSFLAGNLLPDFNPSYKKLAHAPDCWSGYINRELQQLSDFKQESTRFDRNYSKRLGVICHFYADFFCYPHTEAFNGSSYQHMKYEWELYRYTRQNYDRIARRINEIGSTAGKDAEKIYAGFTTLLKEYLRQEQSFENDIIYALRACTAAVTSVTLSSIIEKEEELPLNSLII